MLPAVLQVPAFVVVVVAWTTLLTAPLPVVRPWLARWGRRG